VEIVPVAAAAGDTAAGTNPEAGPLRTSAGAVSRRGLFGVWRETARRAVSGVARDAEAVPARVSRQGRAPAWRQRLENDIASLAGRPVSAGGPLPLGLGIGLPLVEGTCDGCGLCALVCPLSALTVAGAGVTCWPGACTACGLCAEVCPTHGLAVRPLDSRIAIVASPATYARAELVTTTSPTGLAARAIAADRSMRDAAHRPAARHRSR
jgi:ferredoxin